MTIDEVYENLCSYDKRNPQSEYLLKDIDDERPPRQGCYCDNCFSGRDVLAMEIIRLKQKEVEHE